MDGYFRKSELRRLLKRFRKLDADKSGTISVEEFKSLPQIANNPLLCRTIDIFDKDRSGEVDFEEFVTGLAKFVTGSAEEKLRFAFQIYDLDRDGVISDADLFQVLKIFTGKNLTDTALKQIVDRTVCYLDKDSDDVIDYHEFASLVQTPKFDLGAMLSLEKGAI